MSEQDTRDKLEADVRRTLTDPDDWHAWVQYHTALEWLDRQAAITARECAECAEGFGRELDARCDPLKERIADLQSQLEEVSRAYKERGRIIAELTAERDRMQKVIRKQAESFRKLEAMSPADCTECAHLDELRALRRRIRKLARFAGLLD